MPFVRLRLDAFEAKSGGSAPEDRWIDHRKASTIGARDSHLVNLAPFRFVSREGGAPDCSGPMPLVAALQCIRWQQMNVSSRVPQVSILRPGRARTLVSQRGAVSPPGAPALVPNTLNPATRYSSILPGTTLECCHTV